MTRFLAVLVALALGSPWVATRPATAGETFQPGDVVLVPDGQVDREGRVVRQDEHGVLVRFPMWDGRWDEVNGPTRYYEPTRVRRGAARPEPAASDATAKPSAPPTAAKPGEGGLSAGVSRAEGTAPLTQAEVLGFLRERIGTDPWSHPKKAETVSALAALIRKRGVDFRWETTSAFADELRRSGGNETTIPFHLAENFGRPKTVDELMGTWRLSVHARFSTKKEGRRHEADVVATTGSLVLRRDGESGSWEWRTAAGAVLRGTWRRATDAEMATKYRGGAGVVIEKGRDGWTWIVTEFDPEPMQSETVAVSALGSSYKELGAR
jgi:hypothetical protein